MKNYFFKSYNGIIFLIWTIIIFLVFLNFINRYPFLPSVLLTVVIFLPTILVTHVLSNHLLKIFMLTDRMHIFAIWFLSLSLLLSFIYALIDQGFDVLLRNGVVAYPRTMSTNSLLLQFMSALPTPLLINLGFCGLRFYYEHTKLQQAHLRSQLHFLQEQINPHFMFNVLNNIHILMQKDLELASAQLVKYSDILRYQLYNGKNEWVALKEEIQFLKDVIEVEKMRWGHSLKVQTQWNIIDGEKVIPPLLLITFIENAFKHVSRSLSETGYINILAEQQEGQLYLEVVNSKSIKYPQQNKNAVTSGIGLKNIKERLALLYPKKHNLIINETKERYSVQLYINF